jgi:hypothetical protein
MSYIPENLVIKYFEKDPSTNTRKNLTNLSWVWWLTPVTLSTWETKLGGSWLQPSWAKIFVRLYQNRKKLSVVACTCHSMDAEKHKIGRLWSLPVWA